MSKKIIIGSRGSKLALIYAQNTKDQIIKKTNFNNEDILIKEITTKGDQVQNVRLSEVGGKGLFSTLGCFLSVSVRHWITSSTSEP